MIWVDDLFHSTIDLYLVIIQAMEILFCVPSIS